MTALTQGARLLKRGETCDPECHRTTHRLTVALSVLRQQGITPTFPAHAEKCDRHPERLRNVLADWRQGVACTCGIGRAPAPTWPEWVTDDIFNAAYRFADLVQTQRGGRHRADAGRAKAERERADRDAEELRELDAKLRTPAKFTPDEQRQQLGRAEELRERAKVIE